MQYKRIALDVMGGDHGPAVVVPAALRAVKAYPDIQLILVGDSEIINAKLKQRNSLEHPQIKVKHASEQILNDDTPATVIRRKKDSSMRVALLLVKEGEAEAAVSAGNTGALMVLARLILKTLPGIDRPAIVHKIPSIRGFVQLLDLGANVDCNAQNLYEFAVMGSIYSHAVDKIKRPRVALLNIGSEAIKGSDVVKKASQMLADEDDINYTGFVEGDGIFKDYADVVVCDGFVGNVTLKASEGVTKFLFREFRNACKANWKYKFLSIFAYPILRKVLHKYDPNKFNGASFLGIQGNVIKSHGGAGVEAFTNAINTARLEIENNVPQKIVTHVEQHLTASEQL